MDDPRVLSGMLFVIRNGLRRRDAPGAYGPHKTIHNRFVRWSRMGMFNHIFAELARSGSKGKRPPIGVGYGKRLDGSRPIAIIGCL